MKNKSDKELFQSIKLGDEHAFQCLFNRHWEPLFKFIRNLTGDEDLAKDVLQNAFIEVWDKKDTLTVQDSVMPYLMKVTKNEVISLFRKEKIRLAGEEVLIANLKRVNPPDEQLIAVQLQSAIDTELVKMPLNMRQCFRLSRYEQKSIHDISTELKLSEQTVKNNISEALRRLHTRLNSGAAGHLALFSMIMLNLT